MKKPGGPPLGLPIRSGAFGHARHQHARGHDVGRNRAALDQARDFRMNHQRPVERLGDAVRRDVVVRRTDAARREHVVELRPHGADGVDDRLLHVGNDPRLTHANAPFVQLDCNVAQVGVLCSARQDFVADDQHAGGDDLVFHGVRGPEDDRAAS